MTSRLMTDVYTTLPIRFNERLRRWHYDGWVIYSMRLNQLEDSSNQYWATAASARARYERYHVGVKTHHKPEEICRICNSRSVVCCGSRSNPDQDSNRIPSRLSPVLRSRRRVTTTWREDTISDFETQSYTNPRQIQTILSNDSSHRSYSARRELALISSSKNGRRTYNLGFFLSRHTWRLKRVYYGSTERPCVVIFFPFLFPLDHDFIFFCGLYCSGGSKSVTRPRRITDEHIRHLLWSGTA